PQKAAGPRKDRVALRYQFSVTDGGRFDMAALDALSQSVQCARRGQVDIGVLAR
ncbi:MAG: hypothetical protein JWO48_3394, partial [Bryobacterales bacterium]|nr:hypothetical protein [Bryobacterales bacterium]